MDKIAMYKDEIYKQAKIIVDRQNIQSDGKDWDSVVVINKPWHRRVNGSATKNYHNLVTEDIITHNHDKLKKFKRDFSSSESREEKKRLLEDILRSGKQTRVGYRAPKPLLFGRKKFDKMKENKVRFITVGEDSSKEAFIGDTINGFSKKLTPEKLHALYKARRPKNDQISFYMNETSNIKKTAGVIGGMLAGSIAGTVGGWHAGKGVGKLFNPRDKEMKGLHKERDNLIEEKNRVNTEYDRVFNNAFDRKEFEAFLDKQPNKNSLTVGQVENLADKFFHNRITQKRTEKVASLKSTLIGAGIAGIPLAALTAIGGYGTAKNDNKNKDFIRKQIDMHKARISEMRETIENPKKLSAQSYMAENDHQDTYSPSNLMSNINGVACEGEAYYGGLVNHALKAQGKDYKQVNWNKYKNAVSDVYNDTEGNDQSETAKKSVEKHFNK